MRLRLAAVYAHPDDDGYSIGGVLALHGGELGCILIVATSGEAGQISDPSLASPENLAQVREGEQREALRALGIDDPVVHFLRYPDGALGEADHAELVGRIRDLLKEARPHVVVTFGPEGVTGHPDHTRVSQAATEAFHQARTGEESAPDGAFQRLFYNAIPESELQRFWEKLRERGVDFGLPDDPFMPRGVPDHTVTATVDCRRVVGAKLEAIRAHRTQAAELQGIPEDLQVELLSQESFVLAWPPVSEPQGATLTDPFEGLHT
jgi:LmbE family N-acetylglucosaminyl deacetylase